MIGAINYYYSQFGLPGLISAFKARNRDDVLMTVNRAGVAHPFYLRCRTCDVSTFDQVFVKREYDFHTATPPRVIVDAGANIGLASLWFASRFPTATIFAIEPEAKNFELLAKNVAPYDNIVPIHAALWNRNEDISLVDPGLGNWGFMTQGDESAADAYGVERHRVPGMTVDRIMRDHAIEAIDILKIDIEGAEREVFADSSAWIAQVRSLVVELHDDMKPGCSDALRVGTPGFDTTWRLGENHCLSRGGYLLRGEGAAAAAGVLH